jgi:FixJ family two-component response regulator/putative methionine-R-sulfoxide reductase with GAF domain
VNIPFISARPLASLIPVVGATDVIRVMLIDDDKDEESLTRSLLARVEDIRYELDWVPTFLEGLASIARGEHAAYLIDHQLGGRTGIDLVREARQAGSLAALIMLTGIRDRATDLAAMEAGATDFLTKGKTDAALLDRTLRYSISNAALVSTIERSRSQMAGLEEIGRILVDDGPTPATVERVVELIVDRFGLPQIAIYLVDGDKLYPAGQRGYRRQLPNLSRADAGVDRVFRARQPVFVPSFSPNTGEGNDLGATSNELSVPLMVAGELMGLLNVASSVADPIGEQDFAAIRVVADRLTAALAVTRERRVMEERVWRARQQLSDGEQSAEQRALIDGETSAYSRAMLVPLLEVAIASAGTEPGRNLGMLLATCAQTGPDSVTPLAAQARTVLAGRPLVRFSKTELAVLLIGTDELSARIQAADLVASAREIGLDVRCGYAALAASWGAGELITAAQAALAFAQRLGPGTVVG